MTFMRPLDWSRGAGRPRAERPQTVDIIIPVYRAAALLRACLTSVIAETDLERHRVTLVIDGPQEVDVEAILSDFALPLLRNEKRLGFVGSVNRGMTASTNDVILLNSDTVVTPRWVEKLIDAAYSSGDVGTVTPLSNHATLCSVPRGFEENLLPAGFDARSFGELVERVSKREYPRIPTGVGVCLYIRRALLDDIGFFDAARFGLGYGEENDFCFRALARGWVHVADDATFIQHAGHGSFGKSRETLLKQSAKTLERLHPNYMATIAKFMRNDPLDPVRERIVAALERQTRAPVPPQESESLRVVHLVHGYPPEQHAGTELYAYWLVQQQKARHHVAVYTRGDDPSRCEGDATELLDDGVRIRRVTNNFTPRDPFRRNAIFDRRMERDFERFVRDERPDLLHVHHLAGHAFSLMRVAKRLRIPIVLQIQDWWFLCARVNQFDRNGNRCSGPALAKCASCATLTNLPMLNTPLHLVRRVAARAALRAADAYIAGSNAIRDDYAGAIDRTKPFHVLPYGVDIIPTERTARTHVRFGYVGSMSPHKGVHTAVEAMRGIDATLHVWGESNGASAPPNVVFEGRFREDEKPRVFASMDVLLVPSIGLESFGLAAREAMTCGVPVIATSGGALADLEAAEFFPPGDAAALHRILARVVEEPALIDRWRAQLPTPKRSDAHAAEIERVYESVLEGRRQRAEGRSKPNGRRS